LVVAVDAETDQWIQETIRTQFDGTILTIAHRLVTLTDYDRIVVLDNGSVAEEGAPVELLRKHDSIFRCMCEQAGDIDQLMKTFEEAAAQKALRDTQIGQG
jgi:ABC-type multidrug transport system fused ATPase/permease subunit